MHEKNCFLTITYDDDHLPPGASLQVAHWQQFAKALRRTHPFRYFHCGEYGELNGRPHYHAAIFGQDFLDQAEAFSTTKEGNKLYTSPVISKYWTSGIHAIGSLTWESGAYVAGYILKKVTGERAERHYQGRKPEYSTMSRRPGLGKTWLEKYQAETYRDDTVLARGHAITPPKYYDTQFKITHPTEFKAIQAKRITKSIKQEEHQTYTRLLVREKCLDQKLSELKRKL